MDWYVVLLFSSDYVYSFRACRFQVDGTVIRFFDKDDFQVQCFSLRKVERVEKWQVPEDTTEIVWNNPKSAEWEN